MANTVREMWYGLDMQDTWVKWEILTKFLSKNLKESDDSENRLKVKLLY